MQNLAAAAANDLIDDETIEASGPTKRLKVSDINISRYEEEFLKIREIASGTFGTVSVARHRLDGMVYAIKVSSWKIYFFILNRLDFLCKKYKAIRVVSFLLIKLSYLSELDKLI